MQGLSKYLAALLALLETVLAYFVRYQMELWVLHTYMHQRMRARAHTHNIISIESSARI